jgi:hypothetical protein
MRSRVGGCVASAAPGSPCCEVRYNPPAHSGEPQDCFQAAPRPVRNAATSATRTATLAALAIGPLPADRGACGACSADRRMGLWCATGLRG